MPAEISWINQKLQSLDRDPDAFTQLYGEMKKPMYAVAYRITGNREDAEDSVADAFLGILRKAELGTIRNGRAYLFQTVRNEALRRLRDRESLVVCEDPELLRTEEPGHEGDSDVSIAMGRLSSEERQIVSLRAEAELGYAEIARITGLSTATVFRRYRAAIRNIRAFFARGDEYLPREEGAGK